MATKNTAAPAAAQPARTTTPRGTWQRSSAAHVTTGQVISITPSAAGRARVDAAAELVTAVSRTQVEHSRQAYVLLEVDGGTHTVSGGTRLWVLTEPVTGVEQPAPQVKRQRAVQPAKVEAEPAVDLLEQLVAGLAAEGVTVEVKWNPKGTYARLLLDGRNVSYADRQGRKGMKVQPALTSDDVPAAKRGVFKATGQAGGNYGLVAVLDASTIDQGVRLVAAAAAKRGAAAPAAAEPVAPRKRSRRARPVAGSSSAA
jgi:hypothetical protein